ncbi:MAG: mechanosensitive ion channel family protein [Candidatus Poseidoniaceae archaeon]|nr:mechanosensitive ion channel family protein [Candidatus Poseidoniaceae archaeon]HJM87705.1 mechanosensitive ion channel family protein [Candidatus Thalassarchaeaceae archaeon]
MSQIVNEFSTLIDWLNSQSTYGKIAISIAISVSFLLLTKHLFLKKLGDYVTKTKAGWDDDLFGPLSIRTLIFSLVICINVSLAWVSPDALESVLNALNVVYIIIFSSMVSITIKIATPPFFAWINTNSSGVAVTGRNNFVSGLMRIVVWCLCIYLILNELELEITGILASLAVFSLIIGMALQHTIGNILNSFLLAIDRPFDVGDRIEVDGIEGKVVSSGILSTKILTWSEELIIIPNNTLVSSTIRNMARGGGDGIPKRINLLVDISVSYDEDSPHVKQVLLSVADKCPYTLDKPNPRVLLISLGEYSMAFRIYAWIADYSDEWPARDWILQKVCDVFEEEGIVIPYPVNIELKSQQRSPGGNRELTVRRKTARQHAARLHMARADEVHREERETVKSEIAWLEKQLTDKTLGTREKEQIRSEIAELSSTLDIFDGE